MLVLFLSNTTVSFFLTEKKPRKDVISRGSTMKHNFKELTVWQKTVTLTTEIYRLTDRFPTTERYCLSLQMRRSAISIGSNIAEGCGRGTNKDFARFLHQALGSCRELEHQLIVADRLQLADNRQIEEVRQQTEEIAKMLCALIKAISGVPQHK